MFKSDGPGTFRFTVKVDLDVKITVGGSGPTVKFEDPVFEVTKHFQAGRTSLQIGARVIINELYIALCIGPVCTGPFVKTTQAIIVGFDSFAGEETSSASKDVACVQPMEVFKKKLEPRFVDWEYP